MINLKNYSFFLVYILFNPRLITLLFRNIYIPVFLQYEWLKKYNIGTVIDVGSYHGHVSKALNYLFPKARIYAFEPNINNFKFIKPNYNIANLTLSKLALSDKAGLSHFYIHPLPYLSSLLKIDKQNKNIKVFNKKTKKVYVKTTTLDIYFNGKHLNKNIFLKIDTQGSEGLVLKGGKEFLKKVAIIHIETSFNNFYQNQKYFYEIYDFLTKLGFRYRGEINEAQFYPFFNLPLCVNSVFINNKTPY